MHQPRPGIVRVKGQCEPAVVVDARGVPTRRSFPIELRGVGVKRRGTLAEDEEVVAVEMDGMRDWWRAGGLLL
jgi:hypothetical protein